MSRYPWREIADDPVVAEGIRREVDRAPATLPADAVDLLRRHGCPTVVAVDRREAS